MVDIGHTCTHVVPVNVASCVGPGLYGVPGKWDEALRFGVAATQRSTRGARDLEAYLKRSLSEQGTSMLERVPGLRSPTPWTSVPEKVRESRYTVREILHKHCRVAAGPGLEAAPEACPTPGPTRTLTTVGSRT